MRRPLAGDHYSIERLFQAVVAALPNDRFDVRVRVSPIDSKGVFRRLALIVWATCCQGDINHISGDINFIGLLMRRSRTLLTITDSASMNRLVGFKRWFYRVFWLELPIRRAGYLSAISEATLQETINYVSLVLPNSSVIPCCTPIQILSEPRPFPDNCPRLLVVGTRPNKNLSRIIEALSGVPCLLVLVGALSEEHQKLSARHGIKVENHVDVSDSQMAQLYRNADMVVFVSTYEGFGLPILEGQAVGRPVITSARSPMKEVAGVGACLVDPESIMEIREAVLRVIHDSKFRAELIQAGIDNVKFYSPEIVALQYASVYEALLSGKVTSSKELQEFFGKSSSTSEGQISTLHVLGQMQPQVSELNSSKSKPGYFAEMYCFEAASLLGLNVKTHIAFYTRNIFKTLYLTIKALNKIKRNNEITVVWQGYGAYAIFLSILLRRKPRFILNTYKVPFSHPQSLWKNINDIVLRKVTSAADGVIAISLSQANSLKSLSNNVAWIPFASDANWWKPGLPDYSLLVSHGVNYRDYILIMGDVDRDELTTIRALSSLNRPLIRVTRESKTALAAKRAFRESNITKGDVLVNVTFELLRELYRGARAVVVPAKSDIHPAGMTSLTEAMSCGRPVVIPRGMATDGYVEDCYDAFVLEVWEESALRDRVLKIFQTDIGEFVGRTARNTVEKRLNFHESANILADFVASVSVSGNTSSPN